MNLIPEAIEFRKSAEVPILKREKNKVVMLKITINSIDNKTIYGDVCAAEKKIRIALKIWGIKGILM